VLIVEIDGVDPEPPQRAFACAADVGGAAVDARDAIAFEAEPELGGDHQAGRGVPLIASPTEFLVLEGSVYLGGVEEGDAELDPRWNRGDASSAVASPPYVMLPPRTIGMQPMPMAETESPCPRVR
jgi:hypothetical protein